MFCYGGFPKLNSFIFHWNPGWGIWSEVCMVEWCAKSWLRIQKSQTTTWHGAKNLVNKVINYQPQLVIAEFLKQYCFISSVSSMFSKIKLSQQWDKQNAHFPRSIMESVKHWFHRFRYFLLGALNWNWHSAPTRNVESPFWVRIQIISQSTKQEIPNRLWYSPSLNLS